MAGWVRVSLRGGAVLGAMVLAAGMTGAADGGARAQAAGSPVFGVGMLPARAGGGVITTVAGGVGGPGPGRTVAVSPCAGINGDFNDPLQCDVTFAGGRLYVTDTGVASPGISVVRSVDFGTGRLATPVGDGVSGFGGDGGRARSAAVNRPGGVSADRHGNLVVADTANNRVRVVAARRGVFYGVKMTAGRIYTVAGTGSFRTSGNGGPARKAGVFSPSAARVDRHGNLVIAQNGLSVEGGPPVRARLRVVAARTARFYGLAMKAGDIYTIPVKTSPAAAFTAGHLALRIDHAGNLVLADSDLFAAGGLKVVAVRTGTFYGKKMTAGHMYLLGDASHVGDPAGMAVDAAGNLVVADFAHNLVRVLAVKTGTFYGQQMTAGGVYTIAGTGSRGFSGDGGPATSAALDFRFGAAVAVDSAGNVAVADSGNARVRVVAARSGTFYGQHMTGGDIYTIAGNGADGIGARFSGDGGAATKAEFYPLGVAGNPAGAMAVASLVRARFVPARAGSYFGQPMAAGHIYTVAGNGSRGFGGDGGPGTQAEIDAAAATLDHVGNLLLADFDGNAIRVVAVRSGTFYGRPMTAGDIYTVAGTGPASSVCGSFAGDGGPATAATLCQPNAVTVDHDGNLLLSDSGFNRVRAVAAKTGTFYGQPMTAGDIYTIAGSGKAGLGGDGGPATKAGLVLTPGAGLAVDGRGNLMVTEEVSVRMVAAESGTFYGKKMTSGDIYTIARARKPGHGFVLTVTTDPANNVIFGEGALEATLVRVLAARSGRFYGHQMTANHTYTVAGGGRHVLGDRGPATAVALAGVRCLAAGRGGFLIAEIRSGRIREVSR